MNLKKILAGVAAGAMIVSTLALPTFADDTVDTVTYDYETTYPIVIDPTASPNYVQFDMSDFDLGNGGAIQTITIVATVDGLADSYATQYWYGGGGSLGFNLGIDPNSDDDWVQSDFALDGTNLTSLDMDTDTATFTLDFSSLTSGMVYDTDGCILQIGWWWCIDNLSLSVESISVEYEYVEVPVVTALTAEGVSYDTPYVVTSADDTENDYVSGVLHIDALNYNDSTYASYWNDYCTLKVAVTVDGVTTYYAVIGSSVGWDVTVDDCGTDDKDDDIIIPVADCIVIDTENGTDIAVDLDGDEWSIEVVALGWNDTEASAACAYASASVTLTTAATTGSNTSTGTNTSTATSSSSNNDATSSSNNDANAASDDGDFAYVYLFAIVALAGVALVGSKKYHA